MTVASEVNRAGPYNGNGVTTVFGYGFRILDATHLHVIKTDATGAETDLAHGVDYVVSGVGSGSGGDITVTPAPATGTKITILRNVPFTQTTDLENQGAYYAETIEAALDLSAMRDQQIEERLDRAVVLPASADIDDLDELVANINRLGDSADNIDIVAGIAPDVTTVADIAADVSIVADHAGVITGTAAAVQLDEKLFTGNGATTAWTLDRAPGVDENVLVWIGGAIQDTADYSVSGTTLTISPAVDSGVKVRTLILTLLSSNEVAAMRDAAAASAVAAAASASAANVAAEAAIAAAASASGLPSVATIAELKGQPSTTTPTNYLRELGREGIWGAIAGDFSSRVAEDAYAGLYAKPDDAAANVKALVRQFEGNPRASWFGISPLAADKTLRLQSASKVIELAGQRVLDIGDSDLALEAIPDIHALANVTFVGKGRFTGTNRPFYKPVIPRDAGSPDLNAFGDIVPERQLKYINAAYARGEALVIELFGDSTATEAPNTDIAHNEVIAGLIRQWAARQWPGAAITIRNRAIGGRTLDNWDQVDAGVASGTLTASYPWFNQGQTWDSHIGRQYPAETAPAHLVICNFGRNHNVGPDTADLVGIANKLAALPLDQIWIVAGPPSLTKDPGGYQASWWNNQIATGGLIRTYCQFRDFGFIDLQRWYLAHVYGFDIRASETLRAAQVIVPTGAPSSDSTATEQTINGQTLINFDGSTWNAASVLQVGIASGGVAGASYLQISRTGGGNFGFQWTALSTSNINSGSVVDSGVAIPAGAGTLVVEYSDGFVSVWDTENTALTTSRPPLYASRFVGKTAASNPYVYVRGGGTTLVLTQVRFRGSEPRKFMPTCTDRELYFDDQGLLAGNDINHETSRIGVILRSLFDTLRGYTGTPKLLRRVVSGPIYVPGSTVETDGAAITIPANSFIKANQRAVFEATFTLAANANTKIVRAKVGVTTLATYNGVQSGGQITIRGKMLVDNAAPATAWVRVSGEVLTSTTVTPFNTALRIDDGVGNTRFLADEIFKVTMQGSGVAAEIYLQDFEWRQTG